MEKEYRNLGYIFMLFIPLTFFGFYKTYFVLSPEYIGSVDVYTHIHAFIASLWIILLISQPLLIRFHKYALHKSIGKFSYIVFGALLLSFIPQMFKEYGKGYFPLNASFDVILLLLFYVLSIKNTKNVGIHMRYMIAISLIFIGPTLGRIIHYLLQWDSITIYHYPYILVLLILTFLILWDKKNKRNFMPYLVAFIAFSIYLIALYTIDVKLD